MSIPATPEDAPFWSSDNPTETPIANNNGKLSNNAPPAEAKKGNIVFKNGIKLKVLITSGCLILSINPAIGKHAIGSIFS